MPFRAFSLIEMMVVVGMLGVLAALAVPTLVPEVHKAQLNGDTEAAANFLARTRAEAMRSKRCTRVLVTASELTAQRLNSFNCDTATPTQLIDGGAPAFIEIDSLKPEGRGVRYSIAGADGGRVPDQPGGTEIRFRPNGRVFSNDALANTPVLTNDDAVLVVLHLRLPTGSPGRRKILVEGNGLICALPRGEDPSGASPNFSCPD